LLSKICKSRDSSKWYSHSFAEPKAICKYFAKSAFDPLPQPSAILAGMEIAARRILLVGHTSLLSGIA
jgi:hypothetical protein